ncbi:MAG: aminotransferase class V-fold PLP-dependent enzyme [Thermoleophilaceae bacterium]|nr:aminotransferase class V-fold PLP-dependent enzyme [Thermoleophilaceae bacterium]
MDDLRAQFPVFERTEYLNAGTNGPIPRQGYEATLASLRRQLEEGRSGKAFFDECVERSDLLRGRVAALIGAELGELALTGSTTDGVNAVLAALDLGPDDEVLTSEEEHPGVLAPLGALRERRGVSVRVVPFVDLPAAVGPRTRIVACSHVSWMTGAVVDAVALAATPALVLLDGAQGLGAVAVDVEALGCDFYAASGQKWLCGPNGLGYLYVRAELAGALPSPWPGYYNLADSMRALEFDLHPDARRLSVGFPLAHHVDWALAALDVLEQPGLVAVQERAAELAAGLAARLGSRVRPRGRSTLVSWEVANPDAEVERLRTEGFAVRELPGTGTLRASVGAWSSESALARLAELTCR